MDDSGKRDADQRAAVSNVESDIFFSKYALYGAIPFVMLMLFLSVLGIKSFLDSQQTASWPATRGIVVRCHLHRKDDSQWTEVAYTYSVDGNTHTCNTVSHNSDSTGYGNAQAFADEHPVGSEVAVYYNPEKPSQAVLIPGVDVMGHLFLACPIIVLLVTLSTVLSLLRYNHFVGIVKNGDLSSVKEACYKIGYGQTPLRALLAAAERPDDAILKEVIKGSTPKEITHVIAYCDHVGNDEACERLLAFRVEETDESKGLERRYWRRKALIWLLWILPVFGWLIYIVLTKAQ